MSVSAPAAEFDLLAVAKGDDAFDKRMADFKNAKAMAEQAMADLQLGKDAKAAHDDAVAKQQEAVEALAAAKEQAEAIIAKAKADAKAILMEAQEQQAVAAKEIQTKKAQLEDWINQEHAAATALREQADKANAEAQAELKTAQTVRNNQSAVIQQAVQVEVDKRLLPVRLALKSL